MNKTIIAGGLAALLIGGIAFAAPGDRAARLDPNGDGKVTLAEMQQRTAERFAALDVDRDGSVSTAEFAEAREKRSDRRADMRGRGENRGGEMRHRRGHRGGPAGGHFARMDANGDGTVTMAEASAHSTERLQRFDADKDGKVTREEFAAAREAIKGRRHGAN